MRHLIFPLTVIAALASAALPAEVRSLDGLVTQASGLGVHDVSVYAYEVARAQVREAATDPRGHFSFPELPAGLYKLIAFKKGFAPAIAVLSRAADQGLQFVELELELESATTSEARDFWSLREAIPGDVLRDIERGILADVTNPLPALRAQFAGSVRAEAGFEGGAAGASQVAGASIDLNGKLGQLDVGVDGRFRQLESSGLLSQNPGQLAELGLRVSSQASTLSYDARRERLDSRQFVSDDAVELAQHRVAWSHDAGPNRSAITAEYVDRGDLYLASGFDQLALPFAERSWRLEGSWEREFAHAGGVSTKVRFVEHELAQPGGGLPLLSRALEVVGAAGWNATPALLVEYGMFTRLGDGSLTLAPRGSLVLQLSDSWQARASASGRVIDEYDELGAWGTALVSKAWSGGEDCVGSESRCARFSVMRDAGLGGTFEVAAVTREVGELVRLTFGDAVLDGLLLLPGDQVPELSMKASHRLGDHVTARIAAAAGEGGGGEMVGIAGSENSLSYRVTSFETQFEGSETGVFVAFHELSQGIASTGPAAVESSDLRRLQVRVTQNLDGLLQLASSWALQVGMEFSRGRLPFSPPEADPQVLRRRVTGGVAVRF